MATIGFYVYLHKRKTDGEVFYVGKGSGKRAWKKTQRNDYWKRVEAKHGRGVEIVQQGLSEDEAFELERKLIDDFGLSTLCNAVMDGLGGRKATEETKAKLSAAKIGKKKSDATREKMRIASTGRRHSEETKKKLSEINTGKVGWKHSEETKQRLREIMKAREILPEWCEAISKAKKGKPGRRLSPEECEAIRARKTGLRHTDEAKQRIGNANRGRKHTAEELEKMSVAAKRTNMGNKKKVLCSNGIVFDSPGDAAEWLRLNGMPLASRGNIVTCCAGRLKTAYGFTWSHVQAETE